MKNLILFTFCTFSMGAFAQMQIDKAIQLTGSGSNAKIEGIQEVVNDNDAASKKYVDTTLAGVVGGGSSMTHTLVTSPNSTTVPLGYSSGNISLITTLVSGESSPTTFNLSGVPSGVTFNLSPGGGYPSLTSTLVFSVAGTATPGSYPIIITSTGGITPQLDTLTLEIVTGYRVFVTSTSYAANAIGSLSNADNLCQTRAAAAGFSGTYQALISNGTTTASSRVTVSNALFLNTKGDIVATSKADFFDGVLQPSGLQWDEFGNNYQNYAWTGTSQTGGAGPYGHCSNWSTTGGNGTAGWVGAYTSAHLDSGGARACTNVYPIYCFGN